MANYMKPRRRSFVAGIISFIGSLVFVYGLYHILSAVFILISTDDNTVGKFILGALLILLCAIIQYAAILYDRYREHRKWKKRLRNAGIEEELPENIDLCWQAYRSNPTNYGLSYIEERNPEAAAEIRAYLEENATDFFGRPKNKADKAAEAAEEEIMEESEEISEEKPEITISTEQDWENGETIIR